MKGVIDAHVHLGLEDLGRECSKFLIKTGYDGNASPLDVKTISDKIEIEKVVLVPSFPCGNSYFTDSFYHQREWLKGFEDKFLQYGTINPKLDGDVVKELSNQYSYGIVGIKLHPVHHFYWANEYRAEEGGLRNLEKVYQFAEDYRLPVLIHTGTSVTVNARNKYADPIFVDDPAKDFKINIILAHSGRPLWTSTAFYMAKQFKNIFLEISSIPPKRLKEYFPRLYEIRHKVIYGSDYPNYMGETLIRDATTVVDNIGYDRGIMKENFRKIANI